MFKRIAREKGKDDTKVRGAGVMRENVPEFMREDLCKRPEGNGRPNSWENTDTSSQYDDESFFN